MTITPDKYLLINNKINTAFSNIGIKKTVPFLKKSASHYTIFLVSRH